MPYQSNTYYARNRETILENQRKKYEEDAEYRERKIAEVKAYQAIIIEKRYTKIST